MTLKFSSKNPRQRRQALNIGVPAQERSRWAGGRGGEGLQANARVGVSGTKLHRAKWRSGAETVQKRCGFGFSMGPARSGPIAPGQNIAGALRSGCVSIALIRMQLRRRA